MPKTRNLVALAGVGVIVCAAWALPVKIFADQKSHASATLAAAKYRNCSHAAPGQACVPTQRPSMLTEYLACSLEAKVRILSLPEALACTEAFMVVKLSFVAGVEPENYRQMPLEEQIEVNRRSYQAFSKWRNENAHLLNTATITDV